MNNAWFQRTVFAVLVALFACPVQGQKVDMDLMAKWGAVTVVRYVAVGEYSGEPIILTGANNHIRKAHVTDRVEVTFDWNQTETSLVGKPAIKNFPSKLVSMTPVEGCPVAKVEGTYEHFDVVSAKPSSGPMIEVSFNRAYPSGSIPYPGDNEPCGAGWDTAAAHSESDTMDVLVPPTMYFAMPSAIGEGGSISKDGKSIILADKSNGWTWTYTPTPAK